MKREIKFKVWDVKNQTMIYDALQLKKDCILQRVNLEERTSDDVVWLQFTGLKDSKGKEIYEGDILQFQEFGYITKDVVVFHCGAFKRQYINEDGTETKLPFTSLSENKVEVIGNIYETTELLTVNN